MILCKIWLKPYFENSTSIHSYCNKVLKETKTAALKDQILLAYLPTKQVALALFFTCFAKGFWTSLGGGFLFKNYNYMQWLHLWECWGGEWDSEVCTDYVLVSIFLLCYIFLG